MQKPIPLKISISWKDAAYRKGKNNLMPIIRRTYRQYPNFIEALDTRHTRYNQSLEELEKMEKEGKKRKRKKKVVVGDIFSILQTMAIHYFTFL